MRLFRDKLEVVAPKLKELEASLDEATMDKVGSMLADLMTMGVILSLHMDPEGSRFNGVSIGDVITRLARELSLEDNEERTLN